METREERRGGKRKDMTARVNGERRNAAVIVETVTSPHTSQWWADQARTGNQTHRVQLHQCSPPSNATNQTHSYAGQIDLCSQPNKTIQHYLSLASAGHA